MLSHRNNDIVVDNMYSKEQKCICCICLEPLESKSTTIEQHMLSNHNIHLSLEFLNLKDSKCGIPNNSTNENNISINSSINIENLSVPELMSCLALCIHGANNKAFDTHESDSLKCPVCGNEYKNYEEWNDHIVESNHNQWDEEVLCKVCTKVTHVCHQNEDKANSYRDAADDEDQDNTEWQYEEEEEMEELEQEECTCLYCSHISVDWEKHMEEVHSFNFRDATRARSDIHDEYDLIRLVNVVRRCIAEGKCPWTYNAKNNITNQEQCSTKTCSDNECEHNNEKSVMSLSSHSLESHLCAYPTHRLPALLIHDDNELIPALRGDALISSLLMNGAEEFLPLNLHEEIVKEQEVELSYPLVPTMRELAKQIISKRSK